MGFDTIEINLVDNIVLLVGHSANREIPLTILFFGSLNFKHFEVKELVLHLLRDSYVCWLRSQNSGSLTTSRTQWQCQCLLL